MKTEQLQSYLDQFWDNEIIPTLTEYIKIPNKSPAFDTCIFCWKMNLKRSVEFME